MEHSLAVVRCPTAAEVIDSFISGELNYDWNKNRHGADCKSCTVFRDVRTCMFLTDIDIRSESDWCAMLFVDHESGVSRELSQISTSAYQCFISERDPLSLSDFAEFYADDTVKEMVRHRRAARQVRTATRAIGAIHAAVRKAWEGSVGDEGLRLPVTGAMRDAIEANIMTIGPEDVQERALKYFREITEGLSSSKVERTDTTSEDGDRHTEEELDSDASSNDRGLTAGGHREYVVQDVMQSLRRGRFGHIGRRSNEAVSSLGNTTMKIKREYIAKQVAEEMTLWKKALESICHETEGTEVEAGHVG